jgi:hypothetical protein
MSRAGDGRRQVVVLRRRMSGRDPDELHRASTPLELLFDLCFVVVLLMGVLLSGSVKRRRRRAPSQKVRCQLVWTGTASSTVRPLATLPLIVPSSWTPPSSPKTPSEARLTRARFVTLWL